MDPKLKNLISVPYVKIFTATSVVICHIGASAC